MSRDASNDPVVALSDVTLTYGTGATAFTALRGISLDVRPSEMTLLLGPSGSGKTTLLQVMGCLLRATTGNVRLFGESLAGRDLDALTALRLRHFGFVFQHYNLFPTLRAWENVAIALDLKGAPRASFRATALALLDRFGLGERADSYPAQLSGGQKQRVAIARAIAGSPAVILADEPTAALDGKTGTGVAAVLHDLAHEYRCAVVVVSHDPRMLPFADRVITLEDGLITGDRRTTATERARPPTSLPEHHAP
jgi:putative ABC transport system ATP-binding protein